MKFSFPLTGRDGWYPGDDACVSCSKSLRSPEQRLRVFLGVCGNEELKAGDGVHFDIHWYGQNMTNVVDPSLKTIRVFTPNDDPEAVLEFCSVDCLRRFFVCIVDALEASVVADRE